MYKVTKIRRLAWLTLGVCIVFIIGLSIRHREMITLPEIIIGLLGIVVAIAALMITETTLEHVTDQLNQTFYKLDGTLSEIKKQEQKLAEDMTNLEDATRSPLKGFAQIFDRSLWLLEQAEREVIYANFVLGFGYAHMKNESIKSAYEALPNRRKPTFEEAVNKFWNTLKEKVDNHRITKLKFVTLSHNNLSSDFLEQLAKHIEYTYLKEEDFRKSICDREKDCREILANALRNKERNWGTPTKDLEWRVGHRLPIQVLIAGLPPRPGQPQETRYGCMVFLLGTESLAGSKDPGGERGFYTELRSIIDMYRDFVDNAAETFKKEYPEAKLLMTDIYG